jgi:pyruvate dehydrogenase E1 component alpha subunit
MDLRSMAAELYGKVTGCCRGRGGSMHLADPENGILGTTAIVGGGIPLAIGAALSSVMKGEKRISVAFFGDGGVDQGVFHEGLNFASLKKLPVVFVCENNFYATNSPQHARQPDVGIAERAVSYGIPGIEADGNDILIVYEKAKEAIERARSGEGPTLIEFKTYRWKAHVGPNSDIELGCRPLSEYNEWTKKCPLEMFKQYLLKNSILSEDERASIVSEVERDIEDAIDFAKSSPFPEPSELYDNIC